MNESNPIPTDVRVSYTRMKHENITHRNARRVVKKNIGELGGDVNNIKYGVGVDGERITLYGEAPIK